MPAHCEAQQCEVTLSDFIMDIYYLLSLDNLFICCKLILELIFRHNKLPVAHLCIFMFFNHVFHRMQVVTAV